MTHSKFTRWFYTTVPFPTCNKSFRVETVALYLKAFLKSLPKAFRLLIFNLLLILIKPSIPRLCYRIKGFSPGMNKVYYCNVSFSFNYFTLCYHLCLAETNDHLLCIWSLLTRKKHNGLLTIQNS